MFALVGVLGIFFVVLFAVLIVYYVLRSLAQYRLLKQGDYEFAWMSWIPFLNMYSISDAMVRLCCSDEDTTVSFFGKIDLPILLCKFWFLAQIVVVFILSKLGFIGSLASFAINGFFMSGIFSNLSAVIKGSDVGEEVSTAVVAALVPVADIVYLNKLRQYI